MTPEKIDIMENIHIPEQFIAQSLSFNNEIVSPYRWWERFDDELLNAFVDKAIENNLDIVTAINRVEIFKKQFSIARVVRFPVFSAVSGINYGKMPNFGQFDFQQGDQMEDISNIHTQYTFNTGLSFEIDLWGRLKNMEKAALANLYSNIEDMQTVYLTVISQVIMTYFDILELYKLQMLTMEVLDIEKDLYDTSLLRYKRGIGSINDIERAVQHIESASAELFQIESMISSKKYILSILLGEMPEEYLIDEITERVRILFQDHAPIPAGMPSMVINQRQDLKSAGYRVEKARYEAGAARADLFPRISIGGLLGYLNISKIQNLFSSEYLTSSLSADISYNFSGNSKKASYDQNLIQYEQSIIEYRKTVLNAFREIEEALLAVENSSKQKNSIEKRLESMNRVLDNAYLRYENGLITYSAYLESKKNYLYLMKEYISVSKAYLIGHVQLYRSLGGNWIN